MAAIKSTTRIPARRFPPGLRSHSFVAAVVGALAVAVATAGCPGSGAKPTQRGKQRVRARSFSESSPVRVLVGTSDYAFAAKSTGLERWNLSDGDLNVFDQNHGLPGERVESMAFDASRGWLWLVTSGGVTRHDVSAETFRDVPPPPSVLGLRSLAGATLAPSGDGGLWIGLEAGLFYTNPDGQWTPTGIDEPVTALHWARDGQLWIGTEKGLIGRRLDGTTSRFGPAEGCDLAAVRFIVSAPGGTPLAVGENADGEQRVVLLLRNECASYRTAPSVRWLAAAERGQELAILTAKSLFTLTVQQGGARRLLRDGARLVPIPGQGGAPGKRSPYVLETMDTKVPAGALVMSTSNEEILVGTRDLGIARVVPGDRRPNDWLRRGELVENATALSVACVAPDQCYIGTGTKRAWRYDGKAFIPTQHGESAVLAFVRSPDNTVYALRRSDDFDSEIDVAKVEDAKWTPVPGIAVQAPGRAGVTFARFSPSGILWMGLQYLDDADEVVPWGVAAADVGLGVVVYHRVTGDLQKVHEGVLEIPINVHDISFCGEEEIWMASTEGVVRVRGTSVETFGEAEGVASELVRGVACAKSGVYAATRHGVEEYAGGAWRQNPKLGFQVNDLEVDDQDRLWMATDRGIALYTGSRVQRLDTRRGLFENSIQDLAVDRFGRIWARSRHGVTLVSL